MGSHRTSFIFTSALAVFIAANDNASAVGIHALTRRETGATVCPEGCSCTDARFTCNNDDTLGTVPSKIGAGLQLVDLQNNAIATIPDEAFDACASSLWTLKLNGNQLTVLRSRPFRELATLRILDLHNNAIEAIEAGAFDGLGRLSYLNVEFNMLTAIRGYTLQNLGKLSNLLLGHNYIDQFSKSPDTFTWSTMLSRLEIDNNVIDCAVIPSTMADPGAKVDYASCSCNDGLSATFVSDGDGGELVRCQSTTAPPTTITVTDTTATGARTTATGTSTTATLTFTTATGTSTTGSATSTTGTGTSTTATFTSSTDTKTSTTTSSETSTTVTDTSSTSSTGTESSTTSAGTDSSVNAVGIIASDAGSTTLAAETDSDGMSSAIIAGIAGGVFLMVLLLAGVVWQKSMKQGQFDSSSTDAGRKFPGKGSSPKRGSNSVLPQSGSLSVLKAYASNGLLKMSGSSAGRLPGLRKDSYVSVRPAVENDYHLHIPANESTTYSVATMPAQERLYENCDGATD